VRGQYGAIFCEVDDYLEMWNESLLDSGVGRIWGRYLGENVVLVMVDRSYIFRLSATVRFLSSRARVSLVLEIVDLLVRY
jgi:hypothetical protein